MDELRIECWRLGVKRVNHTCNEVSCKKGEEQGGNKKQIVRSGTRGADGN